MSYLVDAVRWDHGWELHIHGVGVTQARTLADADAMVRDFLATDEVDDAATVEIQIRPKLFGLEDLAAEVRRLTGDADRMQRAAARASRAVASAIRESGLSVADTATVMGVSRGRVSQLTSKP